jgi:beta-lactamase regulating signal transducer with metallopeptidase domain
MAFLGLMALVPMVLFFVLWAPAPSMSAAAAASGLRIRVMEGQGGAFAFTAPDWLGALWALGVGLMFARTLGGWWVVRDLLREEAETLPEAWLRQVQSMASRLAIRRPVQVRLSATLRLPLSARALRPVVWLPLSTLTHLTPSQLEALLAHELAHVARLDWIWNGLQRLIEALLFFHPGVWWLSKAIRQEREHACDDVAVALCGDAIALAEALATLEGLRTPPHVLALAANGGSLMERIQRQLSPTPPPRLRWGFPACLLALFGAGALMAATHREVPQSKPATPKAATSAEVELSPGSTCIVEDDVDGVHRVYKKAMDRQGRVSESYREDGRDKPVTDAVRRWIAEEEHKAAEEEKKARLEESLEPEDCDDEETPAPPRPPAPRQGGVQGRVTTPPPPPAPPMPPPAPPKV